MSLQARNISFSYNETPVLTNVSCALSQGERICLIGPNGAGKTTLLKCLCGLQTPVSGEICLDEQNIKGLPRRELAQRIAYVPQSLELVFPARVSNLVLLGRYPAAAGSFSGEDERAAREALEATDMYGLRDRFYLELSGGEKKRLLLAVALASKPEFLLLDEPFANLDPKYQYEMRSLLLELSSHTGTGLLCVTHDLSFVAHFASSVLSLNNESVLVQQRPSEALVSTNLSKLFDVPSDFFIETKSERRAV